MARHVVWVVLTACSLRAVPEAPTEAPAPEAPPVEAPAVEAEQAAVPRDTGWPLTVDPGANCADATDWAWHAVAGTDAARPPTLDKVRMLPSAFGDQVSTFRGGTLRAGASHGRVDGEPVRFEKRWTFETSEGFLHGGRKRDWGGSAGWTGQPALIQWSPEVRKILNLRPELRDDEGFVEVIVGSLDGWVYFLDLRDGRPSRTATFPNVMAPSEPSRHLNTGNPIKGAVTIHPEGLPMMVVGQGLIEDVEIGSRFYRLTDGEELLFLRGKDSRAHRGWGAFDSSPLFDAAHDLAWVPGENGLLYRVQLGTNLAGGELTLSPVVHALAYRPAHHEKQGIENSMSAWRNLAWYADNGGTLFCMNLETNEVAWTWHGETSADTNASLAVDVVDGVPYLYRGTEHEPETLGPNSYIARHHGLTGEQLWAVAVPTADVAPMSHGGVYGTPAVGRHQADGLVYVTVSHAPSKEHGTLLALERETGAIRWKQVVPRYVWSSPLVVYNDAGHPWVFQADVGGHVQLLDGLSGEILHAEPSGSLIQASPSSWNSRVVMPLLGTQIVAYDLVAGAAE